MARKPSRRISRLPRHGPCAKIRPFVDRLRRIINNVRGGRQLGLRFDDDLEAEQETKTNNNPSKLFIVFITILIRPGHVRRTPVAGLAHLCRVKTTALHERGRGFTGRPVFLHKQRVPQLSGGEDLFMTTVVRLCSKNDTATRFDGKTISVEKDGVDNEIK